MTLPLILAGPDEEKSGGLVIARRILEPDGRWEDLRHELRSLLADADVAEGGRVRIEPEYLVTTARWAANT